MKSVLFIFAFAFCLNEALLQIVRIPLTFESESAALQRRRAAYRFANLGDKISISNDLNRLFYGTISVGMPEKLIKVVFDTCEQNLWIPSQHCAAETCYCHLSDQNGYNILESATREYVNMTLQPSTEYLHHAIILNPEMMDHLKGMVVKDVVKLGSFTISKQTFGVVEDTVGNIFHNRLPFVGIFGLGLRLNESKVRSPVYTMKAHNLISEHIVSYYVNTSYAKPQSGYVIFGGDDHTLHKGDFTYVNIIDDEGWAVNVTSGSVNSTKFCEATCYAYLDTGTDMIIVDVDAAEDINVAIGAVRFLAGGGTGSRWHVPCQSLKKGMIPSIVFTIGGRNYELGENEYITKTFVNGVNLCETNIVGIIKSKQHFIFLGLPFFRKYYTLLDYHRLRVGFATPVYLVE